MRMTTTTYSGRHKQGILVSMGKQRVTSWVLFTLFKVQNLPLKQEPLCSRRKGSICQIPEAIIARPILIVFNHFPIAIVLIYIHHFQKTFLVIANV